MSRIELSIYDTQIILNYAKRKYAEEPQPLAWELRAVREVLEKVSLKPKTPHRCHGPNLHPDPTCTAAEAAAIAASSRHL